MRINATNSVSFKGQIIDAHAHVGHYNNNTGNFISGNHFLNDYVGTPLNVTIANQPQQDIVVKSIVSNLDCMTDEGNLNETIGNKKTLELCQENPRLAPMAVCQPCRTNGDTTAMRALLEESNNRFIGLKFHPSYLSMPADSPAYDNYMRLAEEKQLPCLFHCGHGNSSPEMIYNLAKRHPNVPVIFAHMGMEEQGNPAKVLNILLESVEQNNSKLYADVSWVNWTNGLPSKQPTEVLNALKALKEKNALDRILFGTDAPLGCYGMNPVGKVTPKKAYEMTVENLKNSIASMFSGDSENVIDRVFFKNADELFFRKKWNKIINLPTIRRNAKPSIKELQHATSGNKWLAAASAIGLALFGK